VGEEVVEEEVVEEEVVEEDEEAEKAFCIIIIYFN